MKLFHVWIQCSPDYCLIYRSNRKFYVATAVVLTIYSFSPTPYGNVYICFQLAWCGNGNVTDPKNVVCSVVIVRLSFLKTIYETSCYTFIVVKLPENTKAAIIMISPAAVTHCLLSGHNILWIVCVLVFLFLVCYLYFLYCCFEDEACCCCNFWLKFEIFSNFTCLK